MTTYRLFEGAIEATYAKDGAHVVLRARDLRRNASGPHAHVGVRVNGNGIAFDVLNIHRLSARADLARATVKRLGEVEQAALGKDLPLMIDDFCLGLWDFHLQNAVVSVQAGCDSEPPPLRFWLPGYVMEEGGTIAFAPPGAGKSYTLLTMAICIDAGCTAIWPDLCQAKVGVVNLERPPASVDRRIYYINEALGLDPTRKLTVVHARGKSLADIAEPVREQAAREKWDVLMLDSISRAGMGKLIDDVTGNAIVDTLHSLAPGWVALGHMAWADTGHEFGTVMFRAGEDIGLQLLSQSLANGSLGVGFQVVKANDIAKPPLEIIAFDFSPGVNGHLAAIRRGSNREFPQLAAAKPPDLADQVYQLLLDTGAFSATDAAAELGRPADRPNISQIFTTDPRFQRLRKEGKSVLYGAISPFNE